MFQATDLLGNPIVPGDTIAFGERYALSIMRVEEVRYLARQNGKNHEVPQQFAERFNVRASPLVCTASFPCRTKDGGYAYSKDVRDHDGLTPETKTISVDKVDRIVKL